MQIHTHVIKHIACSMLIQAAVGLLADGPELCAASSPNSAVTTCSVLYFMLTIVPVFLFEKFYGRRVTADGKTNVSFSRRNIFLTDAMSWRTYRIRQVMYGTYGLLFGL